jgi:UMF1 family MFS transporter
MGGLACLALVLVLFVQTERPLFGLDKGEAEHVRVVALVVAVWFAVFAAPTFLFVPDERGARTGLGLAVREGLRNLIETLRQIRKHGNIARFLVARLFYVDAMNTMFAFGGIYAAGTFGMSIEEIGPKRTVQIAICGLIALGIPLLLVETKSAFWLLALPLGLFMGPAQAASRSMMAHLAPAELRTEMFGLYALSGKVTAFMGPAVLAWATLEFDSQRAGMATIMFFFTAGFILLALVKPPVPD